MKDLAKEKTAAKGLQTVLNETRDWEGTFSSGGFHRFLSTGFISQDANKSNPRGFRLFMFYPRTVDQGKNNFDAARARMRDLFEADVDEETIPYYSKQGYYTATNQHDLRVQLQTAIDMLSLLLGVGSNATQGLAYVLEPRRWTGMSMHFHERFRSEAFFGPKFIYCLDRSLQQLFIRMENPLDRASVRSDTLTTKAAALIDRLDSGFDIAIRLPSPLQPPVPAATAVTITAAAAPTAITNGTTAGGAAPRKKSRRSADSGSGSAGPPGEPGGALASNTTPHPAWQLPEGRRYAEFFQGRAQSTRDWPLVPDARLGARSPAPLCIRFQATTSCKWNCRLAHTSRSNLEPAVRRICDDRFTTAYANSQETSTTLVTT